MNFNHRRRLLGLNPLPEPMEVQPNSKKASKNAGKKNMNKLKLIAPKDKPLANQVAGLNGNPLLEAINKDSNEMPMWL